MKFLLIALSVLTSGSLAFAYDTVSVDARTMTCADFTQLVATHGWAFDSDPNFEGIAVANSSYCDGTERMVRRTVVTSDNGECIINFCLEFPGGGGH